MLGKADDNMKILEELWYGRINPNQQTQPDDKSSSELTEQIVEKEDELAALLSDEAKEILDQMREKQLDLSVVNEKKAFISGFCIGARIILEVTGWTEIPKTGEKQNDWNCHTQEHLIVIHEVTGSKSVGGSLKRTYIWQVCFSTKSVLRPG